MKQVSTPEGDGVCPVCSGHISALYTEPTREKIICQFCRATGRDAAIANLIANLLGKIDIPLTKLNINKQIYIGNLSGSNNLFNVISQKFSYINTYYHKEPKFDLLNPDVKYESKFDILINSEVLEHIVGDTIKALQGALFSIKPGGWMIFSVPFISNGPDIEHYPGLVSYEEIPSKNTKRSAKLYFDDGRVEIDTKAVFHGGSGSTLEIRLYNRTRVIFELLKAGFESISIHDENRPSIGVQWGISSRMITARRPF